MFRVLTTSLSLTLLLVAGSAQAAIYTLGVSNFVSPSPFGQIEVIRTGNNTATVTLTAFSSGSTGYLFGNGGIIGLNLNASGVSTISGISYTTPTLINGLTPGGLDLDGNDDDTDPDIGSGNLDGFGNFNFRLENFDGATHAVKTLSFTLTNTIASWATDADVLTPNGSGYVAGGHVFTYVIQSGDNYVATGLTGYAVNGAPMPEPASLAIFSLLISGVGAGSWLSRRRRAAK